MLRRARAFLPFFAVLAALASSCVGQHAFDFPAADATPRSYYGSVSECVDASRAARRLCGASAAVAHVKSGRLFLYVIATRSNGVAVVDAYRPESLQVVASVSSFASLRKPLDLHLHTSGEYVAVLAAGDSDTKESGIVLIDVQSDTPTVLRSLTNCTKLDVKREERETGELEETGKVLYRGDMCGATAFALDVNRAFVVVADMNKLVEVRLPPGVATAATATFEVVASIQHDDLTNGYAIMVANNKAYVRSDGVCATCVAVVDISVEGSPVMSGPVDVSTITGDVEPWKWSSGYLARGAHRNDVDYLYDWVVNPVQSSVTSVSRECINVALSTGAAPESCAGRMEFAYSAQAEATAYDFTLSAGP